MISVERVARRRCGDFCSQPDPSSLHLPTAGHDQQGAFMWLVLVSFTHSGCHRVTQSGCESTPAGRKSPIRIILQDLHSSHLLHHIFDQNLLKTSILQHGLFPHPRAVEAGGGLICILTRSSGVEAFISPPPKDPSLCLKPPWNRLNLSPRGDFFLPIPTASRRISTSAASPLQTGASLWRGRL